ncbi:MAG: hypothetical protein HKL80_07470, partial [Acidimicrobiales bacterium]|nr:hypothetical protein [Acidimicrobiales bacterium]
MPQFLNDLFGMLSSAGPIQWQVAEQLALNVAAGGNTEPNVDPLDRVKFEELASIAARYVVAALDEIGLMTPSDLGSQIEVINRASWAKKSLIAWKPLLEEIGIALSATPIETGTSNPPGGQNLSNTGDA